MNRFLFREEPVFLAGFEDPATSIIPQVIAFLFLPANFPELSRRKLGSRLLNSNPISAPIQTSSHTIDRRWAGYYALFN
jgi:hypothetical protein